MPGFWESLQGNLGSVFQDYEKMKELKRQRALQKMKFITETGDVGTQVDPETADDITDYAPEAASFIKDGAYTGSADQQREAQFSQLVQDRPDISPDELMQKGLGLGAVSGNAYSNYANSVEARNQRHQDLLLRLAQQKEMQEDRQSNQAQMLQLAAALRGGGSGGGGEEGLFENKAQRQKFATNRKTYLPYGGPYDYFTKHLLNNPESAKAELSKTLQEDVDISQADPWDKYYNHINQNINEQRDTYGMKPEEIAALLSHIQGIANERRK
jgi:hypothetical protein